MKFTLEIDCELPAMQGQLAIKLAAVLAKTAADILKRPADIEDSGIVIVRDSEGNAVGRAEFND